MQKPKMGGKSPLRLFIKANDDVTNSLLPRPEDRHSLQALVQGKYQGAFTVEIIHEPGAPSPVLLEQLDLPAVPEAAPSQSSASGMSSGVASSRLFEEPVDVVVLSVQPDIVNAVPVQQFKDNFLCLIKAIKERSGANIIVYNASSVDPADTVHNYYGREDTLAVGIQRFNLALIELSILEGISIIDVDRLVAELDGAGNQHVVKVLHYAPEASLATCKEFLRVLEDTGFFEPRPLVMQIGQRRNDNAVKA